MPRAGLTTERVIRLGADLADELGFEAVTLSTVARLVDVKVASLYSHVAASADLRAGIARLALTELAGSFEHSRPDSGESWLRILDVVDVTLRRWSR